MINKNRVLEVATKKAKEMGCFIVDVKVSSNNLITILFDHKKGVFLNDCMLMSKFIEENFDREVEDYELSVSSPGAFSPFLVDQQYKKNIGNEVLLKLNDGQVFSGVLKEFGKKIVIKKNKNKNFIELKRNEIKEIKRKIKWK